MYQLLGVKRSERCEHRLTRNQVPACFFHLHGLFGRVNGRTRTAVLLHTNQENAHIDQKVDFAPILRLTVPTMCSAPLADFSLNGHEYGWLLPRCCSSVSRSIVIMLLSGSGTTCIEAGMVAALPTGKMLVPKMSVTRLTRTGAQCIRLRILGFDRENQTAIYGNASTATRRWSKKSQSGARRLRF